MPFTGWVGAVGLPYYAQAAAMYTFEDYLYILGGKKFIGDPVSKQHGTTRQ